LVDIAGWSSSMMMPTTISFEDAAVKHGTATSRFNKRQSLIMIDLLNIVVLSIRLPALDILMFVIEPPLRFLCSTFS